jgi:hypothetical protein
MNEQEEYERWLRDPERIRRRNAAERQIGRAIAGQYLFAFIAVSLLLGIGSRLFGFRLLTVAAGVAVLLGVLLLWRVRRTGDG